MKDGGSIGKADADGLGQVVALDVGLGVFKRPGDMMDVGAHDLAVAIAGKQAVALGKEVLKRCRGGIRRGLRVGPRPR